MDPAPPDLALGLLRELTREAFRPLPKGFGGDETAVHQTRVAARRLRVALPLLARKPAGRRVKRALRILRALTRAAGESRDLDVSLGLLDTLLPPPLSAMQRRIRLRLRTAGRYARVRVAESMLDLEIAKLRKDLRAVLARGADEPAAVRDRLRDALEREAAALLPSFTKLGDRFDPEALHEQRRRVRRLRYASEVGEALRGGEAKGGGRLFKKLQTALGRIHDHALFSAWLTRLVDTAAAKGEPALRGEVEALRARVDEAARALHREMLAGRPREMVRRALESQSGSRSAA